MALIAMAVGGMQAVRAEGGREGAAVGEFRTALARTPDVTRGRELFNTCAACHHEDGSGVQDGSIPEIAGQYLPVLVKELIDFRNDRRWNIRMEQVLEQRHLTRPEDLADIAGYLSSLPRQVTRAVGDGSALKAGASRYFRDCQRCHGSVGEGNAEHVTPRIGGQHYGYLVRQIRNAGDRRRPNMVADHVRLVRQFSLEEINGVADYLARMQ